jgi:hypothetical protein
MENYGDLTLTEDWIESKSARIPIDSISYVRSVDLVPSTNSFFLIASIILAILAIAFFYGGEFFIGLCLAIVAFICYKLSNSKANTLMIASSSGFFINEFSTKFDKSSKEQRHFINKMFEYRKDFIRNEKYYSNNKDEEHALSDEIPHTSEPIYVNKIEPEMNPKNALCPSCNSDIYLDSKECQNCHASFDEYSTWKPLPKN